VNKGCIVITTRLLCPSLTAPHLFFCGSKRATTSQKVAKVTERRNSASAVTWNTYQKTTR
jgi:hypothetical protein